MSELRGKVIQPRFKGDYSFFLFLHFFVGLRHHLSDALLKLVRLPRQIHKILAFPSLPSKDAHACKFFFSPEGCLPADTNAR